MKILSPRVHGYLDYLVVVAFALAPTLLDFSKTPATISYVLAAVHLTETLITKFPLGLIKILPFTVHGSIEFVLSFVLVAMPWIFGYADEPAARNYYVASGIGLFLVWVMTDYKAADRGQAYA
jgi:hypothetical protein